MMNKIIILIIILSTLLLSSCSLPESGLCFQGNNFTINEDNQASGLLKVFNCNPESPVVFNDSILINEELPILN